MEGGFLTPVLGLVGIVAAAALGAFGKEWFTERRAARRAASPVGQAEADSIKLAVSLDRERWLDQQTRGLFETVHEQLERALAEIAQLQAKVRGLDEDVTRLSQKLARVELERDEALDLVEAIRTGRLS